MKSGTSLVTALWSLLLGDTHVWEQRAQKLLPDSARLGFTRKLTTLYRYLCI